MESEQLIKQAPTDHGSKEAKIALHKTRGFAWFLEAGEIDDLDDKKKNGDDDSIVNEENDAHAGEFAEIRKGCEEERNGKKKVEYVDEKAGKLLPFCIPRSVWIVGHGGMVSTAGRLLDGQPRWKRPPQLITSTCPH